MKILLLFIYLKLYLIICTELIMNSQMCIMHTVGAYNKTECSVQNFNSKFKHSTLNLNTQL